VVYSPTGSVVSLKEMSSEHLPVARRNIAHVHTFTILQVSSIMNTVEQDHMAM